MDPPNPWIALGVVASTAATAAVYIMFNRAVCERRRIRATGWSSACYPLSAFAVISTREIRSLRCLPRVASA